MAETEMRGYWWIGGGQGAGRDRHHKWRKPSHESSRIRAQVGARGDGSRLKDGGLLQRMLTRIVFCVVLVALESPLRTAALSRTDFEMQPNIHFDPEYACVYENSPGLLTFRKQPSLKEGLKQDECGLVDPIGTASAQAKHKSGASISLLDVPGMGLQGSKDETWHSDVDRRYKQLIPPRRSGNVAVPSTISEVNLRRAAEVAASSSASLTPLCEFRGAEGSNGKVQEAVMTLDLDKCAFYGNDGNDLGVALQWMGKEYEDVKELYRMLLNPQVKKTYAALKRRAEKVHVVVYTMRATFLVYRSCFRDAVIPLRWEEEWHKSSQIHFPKWIRNADQVLDSYSSRVRLLPEEKTDLRKSLERLLVTRDIIQEELGLDELPDLVVTATPKNVEKTIRHCGLPVENSYLWDDNPALAQQSRVINVQPFTKLPASATSKLRGFLQETIPPETLDPELVDFMMGAYPADRILERDPTTGEVYYEIPQGAPVAPWSLPTLVSSADSEERIRKVGSVERLRKNGYISPVTPDSALDDSWTSKGVRSRSMSRESMGLSEGLKGCSLKAVGSSKAGAECRRESSSDDILLRVQGA